MGFNCKDFRFFKVIFFLLDMRGPFVLANEVDRFSQR